jgi:hypothetical protein
MTKKQQIGTRTERIEPLCTAVTDIEDRQNRITHILQCQGLTPASERLERDATHQYFLMSAVTTQLKKEDRNWTVWLLTQYRCGVKLRWRRTSTEPPKFFLFSASYSPVAAIRREAAS